MKHKIIQTENYLLVGNDNNSKRGWFYCFRTKNLFQDEGEDVLCCNADMNIIAHLPLNNSPILDGVDLLPPLEDEVEKLAVNNANDFYEKYRTEWEAKKNGFIDGYNKAKEKYKYTEEDLKKAMKYASEITNNKMKYMEDYIQSLQQQKMSIAFECEIEAMNIDEIREQGKGFSNTNTKKLKITTNSQGLTQWVGKYYY